MSVTLRAKLESISSNEAVAQLNALLPSAHVSINWGRGQRIVTVDGYEGSIEIKEVASKYLQAKEFTTPSSLQERLDCYELWDRVKQLYTNSEEILNQTWLYKYLILIKEIAPYVFSNEHCPACAGCSIAIINEEDFGVKKKSLFKFSEEEFHRMWPDEMPDSTFTILSVNYIASKEQMTRAAAASKV